MLSMFEGKKIICIFVCVGGKTTRRGRLVGMVLEEHNRVRGGACVRVSEQSGLSEWPVLGRFVGQTSSRAWQKLLRVGVHSRETVTPRPNKV